MSFFIKTVNFNSEEYKILKKLSSLNEGQRLFFFANRKGSQKGK